MTTDYNQHIYFLDSEREYDTKYCLLGAKQEEDFSLSACLYTCQGNLGGNCSKQDAELGGPLV